MKVSGARRSGYPLVAGEASGTAFVFEEPFSFAGGIHWESGQIKNIRSPYFGASVTSRIVVMPIGRGTCSASVQLAEAIRLDTAPRAFILLEADQILAVGAIVARRLYGRICPILVVDEADYRSIAHDDSVTIWKDGSFAVERRPKTRAALDVTGVGS